MADEVVVDGGGGSPGPGATPDAGASAVDSGAALQATMTGNFFHDDGVDAVVDHEGNTQYDENNNPIRTMEDWDKYKARKGTPGSPRPDATKPEVKPDATAKPKPEGGATAPVKFDSLFDKDGAFDVSAAQGFAEKFNQFKFEKQLTAPANPPAQPAATAPIPPVERIRGEVDTYHKALTKSFLDPIRSVYEGLSAQYQAAKMAMPPDVFKLFNDRYVEIEKQVGESVKLREDQLKEELHNEELSNVKFETQTRESSKNFFDVANDLLSNVDQAQRSNYLSQLIFGTQDEKGQFVRGYGADLVEHAFDIANAGRQFKTVEEWQNAYNGWWVRYSSNPNNIRFIAQRAMDRYVAQNQTKFRDAYRSAWDKEMQSKSTLQRPNAGRGGGAPVDAATQQLSDYFTPPQRK